MAAERRKDFEKECPKLDLIHARLGHISLSKMKHLEFRNCNTLKNYFCDTYSVAKHHRLPFMSSNSIAKNVFDLIHINLWGPYSVKAMTYAIYILTVVDDNSRATWTHLLANKEQVKGIIVGFLAHVENS